MFSLLKDPKRFLPPDLTSRQGVAPEYAGLEQQGLGRTLLELFS
jgi:hypothetical protein